MHGGKDLSAYSLILPGGRTEMYSLRADEHFYCHFRQKFLVNKSETAC